MNQSIPFRSPASTKADARGLMLSSKRSLKNIKARYSPPIKTLKSAATIALIKLTQTEAMQYTWFV